MLSGREINSDLKTIPSIKELKRIGIEGFPDALQQDTFTQLEYTKVKEQLFEDKNFYATFTGDSSCRSSGYCQIKTGPLLFSMKIHKESQPSSLILHYLDYETRQKMFLLSYEQNRKGIFGTLWKIFVPFDFTKLGEGYFSIPKDEVIETMQISGFIASNLNLRQALFKIADKKISNPESDLPQLCQAIQEYDHSYKKCIAEIAKDFPVEVPMVPTLVPTLGPVDEIRMVYVLCPKGPVRALITQSSSLFSVFSDDKLQDVPYSELEFPMELQFLFKLLDCNSDDFNKIIELQDISETNIDKIFQDLLRNYKLFSWHSRYEWVTDHLQIMTQGPDLEIFKKNVLPPDTLKQDSYPKFFLKNRVKILVPQHHSAVINVIELENKCFEDKNFYSQVAGGYTCHQSNHYWIKSGPLLFCFSPKSEGSFNLTLCYLDYSSKTKIHIFGLKQGKKPVDGSLSLLFIPFNFKDWLGLYVEMRPNRKMVKIIEASSMKAASLKFRKALIRIANKKTSTPDVDLPQLYEVIDQYNCCCKKFLSLVEEEKKINPVRKRMTSVVEDVKGDSKKCSGDSPELKFIVNQVEDLYLKNKSITDKQIKNILYQYFVQTNLKEFEPDKLVKTIYAESLKINHFVCLTLFAKTDLLEYLELVWQDYKLNSLLGIRELLLSPKVLAILYEKIAQRYPKHKNVTGSLGDALDVLKTNRLLSSSTQILIPRQKIEFLKSPKTLKDTKSYFVRMHVKDVEKLTEFLEIKKPLTLLYKGCAFDFRSRLRKLIKENDHSLKVPAEMIRISQFIPRSSCLLDYLPPIA